MIHRPTRMDLLDVAMGWHQWNNAAFEAAFVDCFQEVYPKLWQMLRNCPHESERREFLLSYRDLIRRRGSLLLDSWENSLPG